jgi:tetratricopeptide (TPR) repeat protein
MRSLGSILCAGSLLLSSSWCHAQEAPAPTETPARALDQKEVSRKLYADGSALYDQADYASAIAAFEKAYAAYPAPAFLFNLAQAERQLGPAHCQAALDYYERYQQAPESAADREEVAVHVAEMRGCVNAAAASAKERVVAPTAAPPPPAARERPAATATWPIPPAAYVLGAVGVAGLATFGTLALLGRNQQSDLERSCSPACSPSQVQPMKTKFLIADIGLAVGAVSLGAAGYLVLSRPAVTRANGAQLSVVGNF